MYRSVKAVLLNRVYEGRAGISHFTRVVRASFLASFLRDAGVEQLKLPIAKESVKEVTGGGGGTQKEDPPMMTARPPFVVCMDEIIKKQGLSHAIFTRALR